MPIKVAFHDHDHSFKYSLKKSFTFVYLQGICPTQIHLNDSINHISKYAVFLWH